jgi:hypothetical protein
MLYKRRILTFKKITTEIPYGDVYWVEMVPEIFRQEL